MKVATVRLLPVPSVQPPETILTGMLPLDPLRMRSQQPPTPPARPPPSGTGLTHPCKPPELFFSTVAVQLLVLLSATVLGEQLTVAVLAQNEDDVATRETLLPVLLNVVLFPG